MSTALARTESEPFPFGMVLNGRYRVAGLAGRGGMGIVYRVHDLLDPAGRELALKTIATAHVSPSQLARLKREFALVAGLRHPNLATVHDFERIHGTDEHGILMELVRGQDLRAATLGADWPRIVELLVPVLRALAFLHSHHVVHFDIKPANILVDDVGQVKVLDFGLAEARPALRSGIVGTPPYIAPESWGGEVLDHRVDLYAFGMMAFQLLSGERAAPKLRPKVVFDAAARDRLPAWLCDLVEKLGRPQPADRHPTANAVIADLARRGGLPYEIETRATRESYLLSSRFVGRDAELATLLDHVASRTSDGAGPPLLLVAGPSGVGKSRLLREARHRCQLRGTAVLESSCYDGGSWELEPIADLLRQAEALAEGVGLVVTPPAGLTDSRQFFEAVTGLWMAIAERVPFVLHVGDLHWARTGTVALLLHLARRLRAAAARGLPVRLSIILSFRDDTGPESPVAELVRTLQGDAFTARLDLGPLAPQALAPLLASMAGCDAVPAPFVERVADETGGNAFFAEEVMRSLVENGAVALQEGASGTSAHIDDDALPLSVADVFQRRVATLDDDARTLLELLAVSARPAAEDVLLLATALDPLDFERALSALAQRRMIVRTREPGRAGCVGVSHDRMRQSVEDGLPDDRRCARHLAFARALETLREGEPPLTALAFHFWRAGARDEALRYALLGATHAQERFAHAEAAELARRALDLLGESDDPARRAASETLGDAQLALGHLTEARVSLEQALAWSPLEEDQARLHRKLGHLHFQRADLERSVDELRRSVELLGAPRPRSLLGDVWLALRTVAQHLLARVLGPRVGPAHRRNRNLELSTTHFQLGHTYGLCVPPRMLVPLLRSLAYAEAAGGDSQELATATCAVGFLYAGATFYAQARTLVARGRALAERIGLPWNLAYADSCRLLVGYFSGDWADGLEAGHRACDGFRRQGDMGELALAHCLTAMCHYRRGELSEAARVADEGMAILERMGATRSSGELLLARPRIRASLGDFAGAHADIALGHALAQETHDVIVETGLHLVEGDVLLREGRPDEAFAALERARVLNAKRVMSGEYTAEILALQAACRLVMLDRLPPDGPRPTRKLAAIRRLLRRAHAASRRQPNHQALVLRLRGLHARRCGDVEESRRHLQLARAAAEARGATLLTAAIDRDLR